MKKTISKLFFFFLIFLVFISSNATYAADKIQVYGNGSMMIKKGSYNGKKVVGGGGKNVCGVTKLCFSGRGVYVYLVRYDSKTRKETLVGKPILYYTGDLFEDQVIVTASANSAKISDGDNAIIQSLLAYEGQKNSNKVIVELFKSFVTALVGSSADFTPSNGCQLDLGTYTYEYEVLEEADKKDVKYRVGKSDFTNEITKFKDVTKQKVKLDLTPDSDEEMEALALFIVTQINKIIGDGATTLNESFDTDKVKDKDLEEYYIAIEFAGRDISKVINSTTYENKPIKQHFGTIGGNLNHTWTCNTTGGTKNQTNEPTDTCPDEYVCNNDSKLTTTDTKNTTCPDKSVKKWDNDKADTCTWKNCGLSLDSYNGTSCTKGASDLGNCTCSCSGGHKKGNTCNVTDSHCITYTTKGKWTKSTDGAWSITACDGGEVVYHKKLITMVNQVETTIQNARASGHSKLVQAMSTPLKESVCGEKVTTSKSKKQYVLANCTCVYYENRNGKEFHECFIGPELNHALVGHKNETETNRNTYRYEFGTGASNTSSSADGVSYWWVPGNMTGCVKSEGGPCNPDDLKCAENFCENLIGYDDRADSYGAKKACILEKCQVKVHTVDPCTDDSKETDPNNNNRPNNKSYRKVKDSECVSSSKQECDVRSGKRSTKPSGNSKDLTNTYSGIDESVPPSKTWCYSYLGTVDPASINPDERTFVNISCIESSSFKFTDPSQQAVIGGSGIYYNATLDGQKKCHIWFDIDSWELEYASYSNEEEVCLRNETNENGTCKNGKSSRKILEEILNRYNNWAKNNYTKEFMETIGTMLDTRDLSNVEVSFDDLNYTITDSNVETEIIEIVDGEEVSKGKYYLKEADDKHKHEIATLFSVSDKTTKGHKYNKVDINETAPVVVAKAYDTLSSVSVKYEFDKYCLSTDQKGIVEKRNICYTIGNKDGTLTQVYGQRVYYPSIQSFGTSSEHVLKFHTKATVNTTTPPLKVKSDNDPKICEPTIFEQDCETKSSCIISLEANDGTTVVDGLYSGENGVKAVLSFSTDELGDDAIESYSLVEGKTASTITLEDIGSNKKQELDIVPKEKGYSEVNVAGMIKLKKSGKTYTCDTVVKFTYNPPPPPPTPHEKCKINLVEEGTKYMKFSITNVISAPKVYTSKDPARIVVNEQDGSYIVVIKRSNKEDSFKIIAEDGERKCEKEVTPNPPPPPPEDHCDCINDFNKDKTKTNKEVSDYCGKCWDKDVSDFNNSNDCVNKCWRGECPIVEECTYTEIVKVQNYCKDLYKKYSGSNKTEKINNCVNACYKKTCTPKGGNFIYRPISNLDPFPQSQLSPLYKGERKIGANWVGYEKYITEDDDDESSVTGANQNINVEYIIDLSPSEIKKIRKDNEETIKNNKNGYVDYKYSKAIEAKKSGKNYVTEYKSAFIHDEFTEVFKSGINTRNGYKRAINFDK